MEGSPVFSKGLSTMYTNNTILIVLGFYRFFILFSTRIIGTRTKCVNANKLKMLAFKHDIGITGWTLNKIIWIHTSYHNKIMLMKTKNIKNFIRMKFSVINLNWEKHFYQSKFRRHEGEETGSAQKKSTSNIFAQGCQTEEEKSASKDKMINEKMSKNRKICSSCFRKKP